MIVAPARSISVSVQQLGGAGGDGGQRVMIKSAVRSAGWEHEAA